MHFAIVEDTESDRKILHELILENCSRHGESADFSFFPSGEAFLEAFRPGLFSVVFMDIMLDRNGKNGMETAKELRKTALPPSWTGVCRSCGSSGLSRFLLNFRRAPARERLLPRGVWRSMISVMRKNRGIFF